MHFVICILLSTLLFCYLCEQVSNVLWQQSIVFSVIKNNNKNKMAMPQPCQKTGGHRPKEREWCKRQGVVRDSTICFVDSHLCRKDKALINLSRTCLKGCAKKADRCIHNTKGGGAMRWLSRQDRKVIWAIKKGIRMPLLENGAKGHSFAARQQWKM